MKPISWIYDKNDINQMEDACAACPNHGDNCQMCVISRIIADDYKNELLSEGVPVTLDDAFAMLYD